MSGKKVMDKLLQGFVDSYPAGCGCIVTKDGEPIYEGYFGVADPDTGRPVDENTVFRLFSSTKVIICTAAMKLFEEGKFLLNEPIYYYFPEWRDTKVVKYKPDGTFTIEPISRPIEIRHCFTMSMGIGYGGNDETHRVANEVRRNLRERVGDYTLREDIREMAAVPVAFEPGEHFLYGFGHELVAGLIEVVSGMTVGEYLKKNIFEPLGMKDTGYRYFGDIRERMISICTRDESGNIKKMEGGSFWDRNHEPTAKYEAGGAGLFSTVRDYSEFVAMMANGGTYKGERIIGRKTIDLMRRNQLIQTQLREFQGTYNAGYGYGLGVRTLMDPAAAGSNGTIGEFGWTGMLGTYCNIDPDENFSVTYMHQMMPNREEYFHLRVRAAAYGLL